MARGAEAGAGQALAQTATVEDAATAVRVAEQEYVSAVSRYRELLGRGGIDAATADPFSRYAALEHLVSVSQAAVRQAPGDPFLNGFLASALAERDAAARAVRPAPSAVPPRKSTTAAAAGIQAGVRASPSLRVRL
jgi:hypothetical protein